MIRRNPANPIIKPESTPPSRKGYRVRGVFNPGSVKFGDEIILLVRVSEDCPAEKDHVAVPYYRFENGQGHAEILEVNVNDPDVLLKDTRGVVYKGRDYLSSMSHIRLARSRDGVNFSIDDKPFIYPCNESECFGVEDARITIIDNIYYITYTAVSSDGFATALAVTEDFVDIKRRGIIFPPQNKDVSIFPEKVNGKYCALHRPNNDGFGLPSIWYSESPDMIHWGNHKCILRPRDMIWEEMKIGGGAAPVKTSGGWLEIYHGKGRDQMYSLFLVLLDLEDPSIILKRGTEPVLVPQETYETNGFFPNVIFLNGLIQKDNGQLLIYYGACDETVCVAETSIDDLLSTLI